MYKVFIDTNVYDSSNYSFRNGLWNQMRRLAGSIRRDDSSGFTMPARLFLQINSVIEGEVRQHIRKNVSEGITELSQAISNRCFAGFRNLDGFKEKFAIGDAEHWIEAADKEFNTLLDDLHVERIDCNSIDLEKVIKYYFSRKYPFEEQKKEEWKDAIAIGSIIREIERLSIDNKNDGTFEDEELFYCVISIDKGFRNAIKAFAKYRPNEDVKVFNGLDTFLNYVALQDRKASNLQFMLDNEFAKSDIEEAVRQGIENNSVIIERSDGNYVEDFEVEDISNISYESYVLNFHEYSDGSRVADISISANVEITVQYSYRDEEESCWDREDREYLFETYKEERALYSVGYDLIVRLVLDDTELLGKDENLEEELTGSSLTDGQKLDLRNSIKDQKVEFNDYKECPESIELTDDELIEYEELDV